MRAKVRLSSRCVLDRSATGGSPAKGEEVTGERSIYEYAERLYLGPSDSCNPVEFDAIIVGD